MNVMEIIIYDQDTQEPILFLDNISHFNASNEMSNNIFNQIKRCKYCNEESFRLHAFVDKKYYEYDGLKDNFELNFIEGKINVICDKCGIPICTINDKAEVVEYNK